MKMTLTNLKTTHRYKLAQFIAFLLMLLDSFNKTILMLKKCK